MSSSAGSIFSLAKRTNSSAWSIGIFSTSVSVALWEQSNCRSSDVPLLIETTPGIVVLLKPSQLGRLQPCCL
jgi:hypothetical protein